MFRVSILFAISSLLLSCKKTSETKEDTVAYYVYLSHTRTSTNDSIIRSVYDLDLNAFDGVLLGGDLASLSFSDQMEYRLDSIFNFKQPNVLWSIGNHDEASDEQFYKLTSKRKMHLFQQDNISFITLDTQDSVSSILGEQKQFLENVLDSVTTKNIVILTHKLIFMDKHPELDQLINKVCNGHKGDCIYCHNPNNFQKEIYPILTEMKDKNIIWIGGDLGFRRLNFEYWDQDRLLFLGNGMDFKRDDNEVLVLKKYNDSLTHHFIPIDSLILYQKQQKDLESLLN